MTPILPWLRRVDVTMGLLATVLLGVLHLQYFRHAGGLWRDEVHTVNVAALPSFADVFAKFDKDSFPGVYATLLHAWIVLWGSAGDATLRGLGFVIGLAIVAALWWNGRQLGFGVPWASLTLLALNPNMIIFGDEVRGYGVGVLMMLVTLGAVWTFVARPSWGDYVVAQVAALLAVQSSYGNCFMVLAICTGGGAVCLRRRAWRTLLGVTALGTLAAVSMLPYLGTLAAAKDIALLNQIDIPFHQRLGIVLAAVAGGVALLPWIGAAALAAGIVGWWRGLADPAGPEPTRDASLFAAVTALSGLIAYLSYIRALRVITEVWYYLPLMALLAVCADVGLGHLSRQRAWGPPARLAAGILAFLMVVGGAAQAVRFRMTNIDLIASQLHHLALPDDLVVVSPWFCGITYDHYDRGPAPWITLPDLENPKTHDYASLKQKMQQGDDALAPELARIEQTLRRGGRVWVIGELNVLPANQVPPLPRAPEGPQGWYSGYYLPVWAMQAGRCLQRRARTFRLVPVPVEHRVNPHENMPLTVFEGWREEAGPTVPGLGAPRQ